MMRGPLAVAIAAAIVLGVPGPAGAIPWDVGGVIPPSKTPPAAKPDPLCEQSYANDRKRGGPRLRFGIGPSMSGENGARNLTPTTPEDPARRDAALRRLRGDRRLGVRLNRLFMSDGQRGIRRFKRLARHYARIGLDVELQVRYHPRPADNGNLRKWLAFVRRVVRAFGPNRHVTGFQITNEINLAISPNTSDGYYMRAVAALVRGVVAAKRESRRRGYDWQRFGFNFAWRFGDRADAHFWDAVGRRGGRRLRRAVDWVGVDMYPGTYVPALGRVVHLGDAFLEGIAQLRECYMPKAGLGRSTPIRIEELGYPTGPNRPGGRAQARALRQLVRTAVAYRGTYHISQLDWFDLRDNNSAGPSFQSYFGLLRDDYSRKPGFTAYRRLIARFGARSKPARHRHGHARRRR